MGINNAIKFCERKNIRMKHTVSKCDSDGETGWPSASSILWSDNKGEGVARERVGRGEDVLGKCEVATDSTIHGCWLSIICDVGDKERVSDVVLYSRHVQCEWSFPCRHHMRHIFSNSQISHCFWGT